MHRTATIFLLGTFSFLTMVPACSTSNNDVGSLERDGSATGGVTGTGGSTGGVTGTGGRGTGGSTGGVSGTGGTTNAPLTCSYQGKTYAIGESFKDDCNTCTCGALGDTLVRCTVMACLGTGGAPSGTGGRLGSGGSSGTGATTSLSDAGSAGQTCTYNGKTYPYNTTWPSTDGCHECWCQGDIGVCDVGGPCDGGVPLTPPSCTYDGKSYSVGPVFPSADGCNTCECLWKWAYYEVACTLNTCSGPNVDASPGPDVCLYGSTFYPLDSHFASADGCNQCHCRNDGQITCTLRTCTRDASIPEDVQTTRDAGPPEDVQTTPDFGPGITPDVAVMPISVCSNCKSDELCVAYYDGTCNAMGSSCNKVSATTRTDILINHARCFSNAMGDEICGLRDGQHFWGCGEPACPSETQLSDINCYGP